MAAHNRNENLLRQILDVFRDTGAAIPQRLINLIRHSKPDEVNDKVAAYVNDNQENLGPAVTTALKKTLEDHKNNAASGSSDHNTHAALIGGSVGSDHKHHEENGHNHDAFDMHKAAEAAMSMMSGGHGLENNPLPTVISPTDPEAGASSPGGTSDNAEVDPEIAAAFQRITGLQITSDTTVNGLPLSSIHSEDELRQLISGGALVQGGGGDGIAPHGPMPDPTTGSFVIASDDSGGIAPHGAIDPTTIPGYDPNKPMDPGPPAPAAYPGFANPTVGASLQAFLGRTPSADEVIAGKRAGDIQSVDELRLVERAAQMGVQYSNSGFASVGVQAAMSDFFDMYVSSTANVAGVHAGDIKTVDEFNQLMQKYGIYPNNPNTPLPYTPIPVAPAAPTTPSSPLVQPSAPTPTMKQPPDLVRGNGPALGGSQLLGNGDAVYAKMTDGSLIHVTAAMVGPLQSAGLWYEPRVVPQSQIDGTHIDGDMTDINGHFGPLTIPLGGANAPLPVQDLIPTPPVPTTHAYTVKSGDSPWSIAQKNNVSAAALSQANVDQFSDHMIRPGDVLQIPNNAPPFNSSEAMQVFRAGGWPDYANDPGLAMPYAGTGGGGGGGGQPVPTPGGPGDPGQFIDPIGQPYNPNPTPAPGGPADPGNFIRPAVTPGGPGDPGNFPKPPTTMPYNPTPGGVDDPGNFRSALPTAGGGMMAASTEQTNVMGTNLPASPLGNAKDMLGTDLSGSNKR